MVLHKYIQILLMEYITNKDNNEEDRFITYNNSR